MRIGILGAGNIAGVLAQTFAKMDGVECYAIASRSKEKAEAFAEKYGFAVSYGSYEDLVKDENVDLVYIATPHSNHYEDMKLCIAHGKPVLCEKAFTMNAAQAKEIANLSAKENVYVTEAIWTRYMPSREMINDLLERGIIGKPATLTANLSYVIEKKGRIIEPALAGGALLDIGVYGLNFAFMHFGTEIERIESSVQMTDTGVDGAESITIFFKDGKMAVLNHSIYCRSDRKGIIHGDKGYMIVENINNPNKIAVYDLTDRLIKEVAVPEQISGYEYQVTECMECLKEDKRESKSMPLADSIFVMEIMDSIRAKWGLVYPQEREGK